MEGDRVSVATPEEQSSSLAEDITPPDTAAELMDEVNVSPEVPPDQPPPLRKSTRVKTRPVRFNDYVSYSQNCTGLGFRGKVDVLLELIKVFPGEKELILAEILAMVRQA